MSKFGSPVSALLKRVRRRRRNLLVCEEDNLKFLAKRCCPRACCLPVGTCRNLLLEDCFAAGGVQQGDGTSCTDPDINCEDTQACCFDEDGSCLDVSPAECLKLGGVPRGKGTSCLDVECAVGGCNNFQCQGLPNLLSVSYPGGGELCFVQGECCTLPGVSGTALRINENVCEWPGVELDKGPQCGTGENSRVDTGGVRLIGTTRWRTATCVTQIFGNGFLCALFEKPCFGENDTPFGTYIFSFFSTNFQGGFYEHHGETMEVS